MPSTIEPTWWEHGLVGLLALGALYAVFRGQPAAKGIEWDTEKRLGMYFANGIVLFVVGGLTILSWWVADRPLADLGFRWGTYGPASIGLVLAFLLMLTLETRYRLSKDRLPTTIADWKRDTPFMPTNRKELRHCSFLALAAGVNEEIFFRGFLITYFTSFTGSSTAGILAAVAIPAVAFGLMHRYQTWRSVGLIVMLSLMFGGIFVLTGSIVLLMVLHTAMDLFGAWLGVRYVESGNGGMTPREVAV